MSIKVVAINDLVARDASGEISDKTAADLAATFYVTGMLTYDLARHAGRTHHESVLAARHELWLLKSEINLTVKSWSKVFRRLFKAACKDRHAYEIFLGEV
jgi:hypothetical protein